MDKDVFLQVLQQEASNFNNAVSTTNGEWIVKGFIDIHKNVYTISVDTKVVSKVLELLLIPIFHEFAGRNNLTLELAPQQNFYPDLTFVCNDTGAKYAVDVKSTYRDTTTKIKQSMTLGAFTGYFRKRNSTKNTLYPYGSYDGHFVLGVIYTKCEAPTDERAIYTLDDLQHIRSVIKDFTFFAQPKYRIASASPGSGNTKNIGSVSKIDDLVNGKGPFSTLGEEVYDDYWQYYLTTDMAKALDMPRPYTNLKNYLTYKTKGIDVLKSHQQEIFNLDENDEETTADEPEDIF